MTDQERMALGTLREAGYAVCLFSPETLQGTSKYDVETAMKERGKDLIEQHTGERPKW